MSALRELRLSSHVYSKQLGQAVLFENLCLPTVELLSVALAPRLSTAHALLVRACPNTRSLTIRLSCVFRQDLGAVDATDDLKEFWTAAGELTGLEELRAWKSGVSERTCAVFGENNPMFAHTAGWSSSEVDVLAGYLPNIKRLALLGRLEMDWSRENLLPSLKASNTPLTAPRMVLT